MVEPITMTIRSTARSYLEIIFHRKMLIVIPVLFATLIAWGYSYVVPPMYRSSAIIQVSEKAKDNPFIKGFSKSTPISVRMGSILQRVRSRSMIEEIVKELNLDEKVANQSEYQALLGTLRNSISAKISKNNLLEISCSYPEPEPCQKIVNLVTRKVIKENLDLQEKETETGIEWINKELDIYKRKLDEADEELQQFQERYAELLPEELSNRLYSSLTWEDPYSGSVVAPPFSPNQLRPMGGGANIYSLRYQNYSAALVEQGMRLKELRKRRSSLLLQLEGEDEFILTERIRETNPVIQSLQGELTSKQVQLARLKVDSTEEHPMVQRLSQEIENLQQSIKTSASQAIKQETTALNPIYQGVKMQLGQTEADISATEENVELTAAMAEAAFEKMEQIPQKKKELDQIRRKNLNFARAYNNLLMKRETAYVTRRLELQERGTKFKILDNAEVPLRPFKPNRQLICLAGFFIGLFFGAALVVLAETTDHSFEEANQLREFLPIPMLGATSRIVTPEEKAFILAKKRLAFLSIGVFAIFIFLLIIITMILGKSA